jgi:UDP-galactopyranose mutase
VEFSGELSEIEMKDEIKKLPGNLRPIMTNYQVSSYVIHDASTRSVVAETKKVLAKSHIHLLGRFAEWEYFNMDTAIASAMQLVDEEFKMPTN